jgi:hypothetical protein
MAHTLNGVQSDIIRSNALVHYSAQGTAWADLDDYCRLPLHKLIDAVLETDSADHVAEPISLVDRLVPHPIPGYIRG